MPRYAIDKHSHPINFCSKTMKVCLFLIVLGIITAQGARSRNQREKSINAKRFREPGMRVRWHSFPWPSFAVRNLSLNKAGTWKLKPKCFSGCVSFPPPPRGAMVLPCMGYIGMCGLKGYSFECFWSEIGYGLALGISFERGFFLASTLANL